jgi:hypothetical protein
VYRVACGGPTEGEDVGRGFKRKTATTIEPVFWRARPLKFYQTVIADYRLKGVIDITAGDGTLMTYCAKERIPYMGFCLSDAHKSALEQQGVQRLLESMFTAGDRLYQPELAVLMKAQKGNLGSEEKAPGIKGNNDGKAADLLKSFQDKLVALKGEKGEKDPSNPTKKPKVKNEKKDDDEEEGDSSE